MKKLSAFIAFILCLSSYPAFSFVAINVPDSPVLPTAYLAIIRFGGNEIPLEHSTKKHNPKTICEIIPENINARNKVGEIWSKFVPVFKSNNWEHVHPDAPFYKIILYYNGRVLTLLLSDNITETKDELKIISTGVAAFNGIIKECKGWKSTAKP